MNDKLSAAMGKKPIRDGEASVLESVPDSTGGALETYASAKRLDLSQIKERVDSLISDQVRTSCYTEQAQDQASTWKARFAKS